MIPYKVQFLIVIVVGCLALDSFAQTIAPSQVEQQRQLDSVKPRFKTGEIPIASPTTDGDDDLGKQVLLRRQAERYKMFQVYADGMVVNTDNVFLTRNVTRGEVYYVGSFSASMTPKIKNTFGDFTAQIYAREQIFRYDFLSVLDFNTLAGGVQLTQVFNDAMGLNVYTGYSHSRFTSENTAIEFYREHDLNYGMYIPYQIAPGHLAYLGGQFDYHASYPSKTTDDRCDYAAFFGYSVNITRQLLAQLTYRYTFTENLDQFREDHNQVVGGSFNWNFTPYTSLKGFTSFTANDSTLVAGDYNVFNVGGSLALNVKF